MSLSVSKAPVWQDCRTIVETAAQQAPLGQVTVENNIPVGAEMFADPLIVKVFFNLMDNAVRYGGKISRIRFSVEGQNSDYIVVCEDDGDGVLPGEKERIFDQGFGRNTGMGLFLAREILEHDRHHHPGNRRTGERRTVRVDDTSWFIPYNDNGCWLYASLRGFRRFPLQYFYILHYQKIRSGFFSLLSLLQPLLSGLINF